MHSLPGNKFVPLSMSSRVNAPLVVFHCVARYIYDPTYLLSRNGDGFFCVHCATFKWQFTTGKRRRHGNSSLAAIEMDLQFLKPYVSSSTFWLNQQIFVKC